MKGILPYLVSGLVLVAVGYGATFLLGPELAPPPSAVFSALFGLLVSGELIRELAVTVARALSGVLLANICGLVLGLGAGLHPGLFRMISPLTAALQACPPVVWISLAMVWAGTGSVIPVAAVFASALPPLFVSTAQGVFALNPRLLAMSRLYNVPWRFRLGKMLLPGVFPYWLAGFSHTLAAGWKVAAVAEFLGSHDGIGARIFWSYRRMEMTELHAWALAVILLGVFLECWLVAPLRRMAHAAGGERGVDRAAA